MYKTFPFIIATSFCLLLQTEGCGRTPTRPNPPTTTLSPLTDNSTLPENHRLPCTANETIERDCLNGGTCFATFVEYRLLQCQCPKRYVGDKCQMIDPTIIFGIEDDEDKVTKAGLAAGITALILFLTVLIFILIWHKRYKRRREREKAEKAEQLKNLNNGDLNNGNYKPPLPLTNNRDSYVETIPLTSLPLNQTNNLEIQPEESKPLMSSDNNSDTCRLSFISSIQYADDSDSGATSATFV